MQLFQGSYPEMIFFPVIPRSRKVCVFSFENLSDYDGAGLAIWEQQFG
jgi:hypothetical protein